MFDTLTRAQALTATTTTAPDTRWFQNEAERAFALPPGVDNGDVDCERCGELHEADIECE